MSDTQRLRDTALLHRFAASFVKLDDGNFVTLRQLHKVGLCEDEWYVVPWITDAAELGGLHSALPAKLPELYQHLILSYRWSEIHLQICRLLPNPAGDSLDGLRQAMLADAALAGVLLPAGFIPFARGDTYDPVCFDTRAASSDGGECPVVRLDHEQAICAGRVKVVETLAASFDHFVGRVLESAGLA